MGVLDHLIPHLLSVQKPARYLGGEMNAIIKEPEDRLRFALAFPDVYEIGMSYTGLPILYGLLNREDEIAAERVFAPWPDMEALMRRTGTPLYTLETQTPVSRMDVLGFTLQYELTATNLLTMLDLSGIPIRSENRDTGPLVMAGGPGATNPEPLAPFIDMFFVGEAERHLVPLLKTIYRYRQAGMDRRTLLSELDQECSFLYVPSLRNPRANGMFMTADGPPVRRTFPEQLTATDLPEQVILPSIGVVHDRVTLEVSRGCDEGCRFCQAGMIYRPARERMPSDLVNAADRLIGESGHDELSLSSLSTSDYPGVEDLVRVMMHRFEDRQVSTALPSLRADRFRESFAEEIKRVRKTGFTIAPEAGSQRLRDVINKNLDESDILSAAEIAFRHGWDHVKLYFMIGLPTEADADIQEMIRISESIARMAKRGYVVMSVSTFVPKPHTPFQWAGMLTLEEIQDRQEQIRKLVRSRKIRLKFHDPGQTIVEGWLARGDRRTAGLVETAWRAGARFDGWMECFDIDTWHRAREQAGVPVDHLYRDIPVEQTLPWDMVDVGIPRSYQEMEWTKAQSGITTPLCDTPDACNGCRACSPAWLKERYRLREQMRKELGDMRPERTEEETDNHEQRLFYRFAFEKTGVARFISHLDLIHVLQRGIRMAGLPVAFTRGFNPKPVLKFGPALELGVAGDMEPFVGEFRQPLPADTVERLNACLPDGVRIHAMTALDISQRKELARDARLHYRITFPEQPELLPRWRDLTLLKKGKRGDRTVRIGDMVERVEVRNREARIEILHTQQAGSLRVSEVVPMVFPDCDPAHAIMVRHQICYEMEGI